MSTRYVTKRLRNVKLSEFNYICLHNDNCNFCPLNDFCSCMALKKQVSLNTYNHIIHIKYRINFNKK